MNFAEFVYTVLLKPRILKQSANWVLKRIIPARIETDNTVIFLNPDDPVISGALTLGMFENEEIAIFKQLFEPDMTFVDVGANVGLYSAMALSVNGFCGKLICLEPHRGSRLRHRGRCWCRYRCRSRRC